MGGRISESRSNRRPMASLFFCAAKMKHRGVIKTALNDVRRILFFRSFFMPGRKPLPTMIKQTKGTLRSHRTNPHEPNPEGALVDPPEAMSEGAQAAWR